MSVMTRRFFMLSAKGAPSGATSASWKQKNGMSSRSKNSNATSALILAPSRPLSYHGRSKVRPPNGSPPSPGEGVPIGDGGADVLLHRLAEDFLVLVVVMV